MGVIQGAVNSMLNTAATAVSVQKHFKQQQQAAEIANQKAMQDKQMRMAQKLSFKSRLHVMEAYGEEGNAILNQMAGLKVDMQDKLGKPLSVADQRIAQAKSFMTEFGKSSKEGLQPFDYERAMNIAGAHSGLGREKFAKSIAKDEKEGDK